MEEFFHMLWRKLKTVDITHGIGGKPKQERCYSGKQNLYISFSYVFCDSMNAIIKGLRKPESDKISEFMGGVPHA